MSLREVIFNQFTTNAGLNALAMTIDNQFMSESVETPQMRPFAVIRMGLVTPGVSSTASKYQFDVYVYDDPADYTNIDRILQAYRSVVLTWRDGLLSGGTSLLGAEWQGESQDLHDDTYAAICRYGSFSVAASGN